MIFINIKQSSIWHNPTLRNLFPMQLRCGNFVRIHFRSSNIISSAQLFFINPIKDIACRSFLKSLRKILAYFFTKESTPYTYLLIQYHELKIELNAKDSLRRRYYIDNLFLKAPEIVKYQYELLELSYQEEDEIRKNLYLCFLCWLR
ncbi:hypothetical protein LCGC14_1390540 [marine sediment metagenome]|uniref:Uncharacterized protein n=1 Tax=marine sediment metagenome TaxID=412755 RepID=A0A0F9K035_9ZZZZ